MRRCLQLRATLIPAPASTPTERPISLTSHLLMRRGVNGKPAISRRQGGNLFERNDGACRPLPAFSFNTRKPFCIDSNRTHLAYFRRGPPSEAGAAAPWRARGGHCFQLSTRGANGWRTHVRGGHHGEFRFMHYPVCTGTHSLRAGRRRIDARRSVELKRNMSEAKKTPETAP